MALFAASITAVAGAAAADAPVVVELYTSQGCSSCPPADAYLGELAKRRDVIALSFHVDYWDYMGWKDPFATTGATRRQRAYKISLRQSYVYTPEIVVGGRAHEVGSNRSAIDKLIRTQLKSNAAALKVELTRMEGKAQGKIAAAATARGDVWLFLFDKQHSTEIQRGENAGRKLIQHNVVREISRVSAYDGNELTLSLSLKGTDGVIRYGAALVVQSVDHGPILGAAMAAQ
ncbi:MAG: DUF1223 domain-containing protein [Alphaproteobacteria bacterium]